MKPVQLRQLKRSPKLVRWDPVLNNIRQIQLNGISHGGNGFSIGKTDRLLLGTGGSYHFVPVSSLSVLSIYLSIQRTSVG
jgi:hypothetical protein